MGFIIVSIVLGIVFLVSVGFAFVTLGGKIAAGAVIALWLLMFGIFSATTVSARSVGIQTGFGKYQKTLDNGFHWTSPTSGVEEFSTQVQNLHLDSADGDDHVNAVNVNYSDGGQGQVKATISWQISPSKAKNLWERHRTFDRVQKDLVDASARSRIREVVGKYTAVNALKGSSLEPIGTDVMTLLEKDFSEYGVEVINVRVTDVATDQKTQDNLQGLIQANLAEQRAQSENRRAQTEKATTELRKASGQLTPEANQRYCLDIMANWDKNKQGDLPAGYNCVGAGTVGIVAPSK